jgi:tetratricopeptide (TPR) repeat protein
MGLQNAPLRQVDIELPLMPCPAALDAPRRGRQHSPKRGGAAARGAIAAAVLASLTGCATHEASGTLPWRIDPVFSVTHTVDSSQASEAYYSLGRYFDGSMAWGRAIDAYRQAVAADAHNVEACNALGVALAKAGRHAEAEAVLRQAVALAPERSHIGNNLGYVLLLEGRPTEALVLLQAIVDRDGSSAIAAANLREAMIRSGIAPRDSRFSIATEGMPPAAAIQVAGRRLPEAAADTPPTPVPAPAAPDLRTDTARPQDVDAAIDATPTGPSASPDGAMRLVRLEVSNGNGATGVAGRLGRWLAARGATAPRLSNQRPYTQRQTIIQYRPGHEGEAARLASLLPGQVPIESQATIDPRSDVRVVLGGDWLPLAACMDRESCRPATPPAALALR